MFMLKCEMLRPFSLFPMHKLGTRLLSNVKLKVPEDDCRSKRYDWVWSETKNNRFFVIKVP